MVGLLVGIMFAAVSPSPAKLMVICEVGSAAMRDLPNINGNNRFDSYYAAPDQNSHGLLTICPELKTDIPNGYRLADDDARSRAAMHIPIYGRQIREAFIYSFAVPELSSDAKSAVVHFSYSCTGLCGGELEARYVRTSKGWKREGDIRLLSVS